MVDLLSGKIKQLWNVTNQAVGSDSKEHARRLTIAKTTGCKIITTSQNKENSRQHLYIYSIALLQVVI